MEKLIAFIESQPRGYHTRLAEAIGRPSSYFWRQLNGMRPFTAEDAIKIEKYTQGQIRCEDILPGLDWAVLRMSASVRMASVT